jgi:hypothetical protein
LQGAGGIGCSGKTGPEWKRRLEAKVAARNMRKQRTVK